MNSEKGLINLFAKHKVAHNILMIIMLLSGVWAIKQLNIQFLPNFALDTVTITVPWRGASAEDVERSITIPLEQELEDLDSVKEITSTSRQGFSSIIIEFEDNTDLGAAVEDVKERIQQVRNLPTDSEDPEIIRNVRYERVAKLILTSSGSIEELRTWVFKIRRELLSKGIAKIDYLGLPEKEIAVLVPSSAIASLRQSLPELGDRIAAISQDIPAGSTGKSEVSKQIRSLEQRRNVEDFLDIPLKSERPGRLLTLGDVAQLKEQARDNEPRLFVNDQAAVEMTLLRTETSDSLLAANIMNDYLEELIPTLPSSIQITIHDESWKLIIERINLLLTNGLGGFILIILTLYIFLNGQIAFWVAASIPISFMAALAALFFLGGSINMVSLFALIMSLGIIVDDSIVVGENALVHMHAGMPHRQSAVAAAYHMLPPVLASSLTTIAAFIPLMLVGDVIGNILFAIPLVVICVILASLVECFLILPGHLSKSFKRSEHKPVSEKRQRLENILSNFRDVHFRSFVTLAINYRWCTIAIALSALILSLTLVFSGRLPFTFFPSPDSNIIQSNVQFVVGTPPEKVSTFLKQLKLTLDETNIELSKKEKEPIVKLALFSESQASLRGNGGTTRGDNVGSITLELTSPDSRKTSNKEFIQTWKKKIQIPAGIESFSIFARRGGPPGADIDIQLTGQNPVALKDAAEEVKEKLKEFEGLSNIKDDMPYGQSQLIYKLNEQGETLGLTTLEIGRQIRAAFQGNIIQIFHEEDDEIEVRIMLPDKERYQLSTLENLPVITNTDQVLPLISLADLSFQKGIDSLKHTDGRLRVRITSDVDSSITNANEIINQMDKGIMQNILNTYNLDVEYKGRQEEQSETLSDMRTGLYFALALIYLILAWVFSSYGWPLAVMAVIPFGLSGALFGHWFMGIDLTILSLFGIFGLSGIVINDSIILVTFYNNLRKQGMEIHEAIVEASCQRLRAVALTSLTTIAGLTPLLFETSLQAQFLIPMAVSISFGLGFATLLVLIVVPIFLSFHEDMEALIKKKGKRFFASAGTSLN